MKFHATNFSSIIFISKINMILQESSAFQAKLRFIFQNLTHLDITAGIYLVKFNNGNTRKMYKICSKLAITLTALRH